MIHLAVEDVKGGRRPAWMNKSLIEKKKVKKVKKKKCRRGGRRDT